MPEIREQTFSVATLLSGATSNILLNGQRDADTPDEASVLLQVSYDEAGSPDILLAENLEFVSDDLRDYCMDLILLPLSEVVESVRD
jgi:hypothetical protein